MKICVTFGEDASSFSAEVMIRRVAWDCDYEITPFHFDELNGSARGIAAARKVSDTDILVMAVRDDLSLPSHVRLWMGLCLGMRDREKEGALVALIIQTGESNVLDVSLIEYLETAAIIGGMKFFVKRRTQDCANRTHQNLGHARLGSEGEPVDLSARLGISTS